MRTLLASMAAAGLFLSSAAAAQDDTYSVSIPYADLDMSSAEGIAAFNGRVKAQAKLACGAEMIMSLEEAVGLKRCRKQLISAAGRELQSNRSLALAGGAVHASR